MNDDERIGAVKAIAIVILVPLIALAVIFLNAFLGKVVWNWYMPKIFNLPIINIYQSIGINVVYSMFFSKKYISKKKEIDDDRTILLKTIGGYLLIFIVAFIFKRFV